MLGVSSAPAIPAQQHFLASQQRVANQSSGCLDLFKLRAEGGLNHFQMFFERALKQSGCGQGV